MEDSINQKQRDELWKVHVNQREKFIYYLIALAVAAIGFSVSATEKETVNFRLIPLAIATVQWLVSIYMGFMSLLIGMQFMRTNIGLLLIKDGIDPRNGDNIPSEQIKIANDATVKLLEEHSNKMTTKFNKQRQFFIWGIVLFVIWRIVEMSSPFLPSWLQ